MKYLTLKAITERLNSIKNRFNAHLMDESTITSTALFIYYDSKTKKQRSRKDKDLFLSMKCDDLHRELVKEYDHVVVSKGKWGRYYIHIKRYNRIWFTPMELYVSERLGTTVESVWEAAEAFNKIHEQGFTTTEVDFPTGDLIFANFFKNMKCDDYAFEMPEDLKYKNRFSINHALGEQNTMEILAKKHGLCYAQLGNTSVAVYTDGKDRIIMTTTCPYYYEDDFEHELDYPFEWEKVGEIICDVWRIECIDQANFEKGDALPIDHKEYDHNKPITCTVNPGIWTVKSAYHFVDDDKELKAGKYPIWVELTRRV